MSALQPLLTAITSPHPLSLYLHLLSLSPSPSLTTYPSHFSPLSFTLSLSLLASSSYPPPPPSLSPSRYLSIYLSFIFSLSVLYPVSPPPPPSLFFLHARPFTLCLFLFSHRLFLLVLYVCLCLLHEYSPVSLYHPLNDNANYMKLRLFLTCI